MKRYEDYTRKELAAMDEGNINRLVDIELAIEGIAPIPAPKASTIKEIKLEKKAEAYSVGGLLFAKQEDAVAVSKMELLSASYDYQGAGYDYKYIEPLTDSKVRIDSFYDKTEVQEAGLQLRQYKANKDQYDKEREKWDEYQRKVGTIREAVWKSYYEAQQWMEQVSCAFETLSHYKDLANGDESVAKEFFKNSYKDKPELLIAVLGESEDQTSEGAET